MTLLAALLAASLSAGERSAQLGALVDEFWRYRLRVDGLFGEIAEAIVVALVADDGSELGLGAIAQ